MSTSSELIKHLKRIEDAAGGEVGVALVFGGKKYNLSSIEFKGYEIASRGDGKIMKVVQLVADGSAIEEEGERKNCSNQVQQLKDLLERLQKIQAEMSK